MNHVNMSKLEELMEAIKEDATSGKVITKIAGNWIFEEGHPQFKSDIQIEGDIITVEADMPIKLGGWGSRPGPLHYCLYGLASCYSFTFSAFAAMEGIKLTKLEIEAEGQFDFSQVFGLTENPIVKGINFKITAESNADQGRLDQLRKVVDKRCPALYCLTNQINVTTELVKS
jgi:uncharacterized OsmC-like protein